MKNKELTTMVAKAMKKSLDTVLRTEANSASCIFTYQPKAPKELSAFRKEK